MVNDRERDIFDRLLDGLVDRLPEHVAALLDEVPLIVEDEPGDALLDELGMRRDDDLLGLHTGTAITERSVEDACDMPDRIELFRGPIMRMAQWSYRSRERGSRAELKNQVRITLLHEIGHHFGLDEDDLEELGYG